MTLQQALDTIDRRRPNAFTAEDKARWISNVDMKAQNEVVSKHVMGGDTRRLPEGFAGYDSAVDADAVLLIPEPYAEAYIYDSFYQMDAAVSEPQRANNSAIVFNNLFMEYAYWYKCAHTPISTGKIIL